MTQLLMTEELLAPISFKQRGLDFPGLGQFYRVRRELTVYKKCCGSRSGEVVVTLRVPVNALVFLTQPTTSYWSDRFSALGKCRASSAWVVRTGRAAVAHSAHDRSFTYRAGERVTPTTTFSRYVQQCAAGIHFFVSRTQAEDYVY